MEALAIVMALDHWGPKLANLHVELTVQSDSVTALSMARDKAAAGPALNMLGATLGILLEKYKVERVRLLHVPGAANVVRRPSLWATKELPKELHGVKIGTPRPRGGDFYPLPTPGRRPELWGVNASSDGAGAWASWH